jgi:hypothetical protein
MIINFNKALRYNKVQKFLIRLDRALSYEKLLEWYDLRRRSGKKFNNMVYLQSICLLESANFTQRLSPRKNVIIL